MDSVTSIPAPTPSHADDRETGRARCLFEEAQRANWRRTDRMFGGLMVFQWVLGIVFALWVSPRTWFGASSQLHVHVWAAVLLGGVIAGLPIYLALRHAGGRGTRHVMAAAQMLMSALLIHLSGGRIETHFHVFGSLAFLAVYRDWRVLVTASAVIAADHFIRGVYWPESVFGVLTAGRWRWLEHAAWVVFEDFFLIHSIRQGVSEMFAVAERQASLEAVNECIERKVTERTAELRAQMAEREHAENERNRMEIQLRHAQKMESIGQLAAGIAHEINTPTQFVGDNIRFLHEAFRDLDSLITRYSELVSRMRGQHWTSEEIARVEAALREIDIEYLKAEIPNALGQSLDGVERVARIVRAMKDFSHPGGQEKTAIDLNQAIDSTLTVARNEWKYVADLVTEFDPALPPVPCLPGEFNQVVLNLVINSAHAIADVVGDGGRGKGAITVSTRGDGDWVEVRIQDTGAGIPEAARERVFEPFFTTKGVGKGTGQGLAIAHSVIVDKHGGTITFETEAGRGTTFVIRLPLKRNTAESEKEAA